MSQRQPHRKKTQDPGFTLIEISRPSDDRIAEAILYLLSRRLQRLAPAEPLEAPEEESADQEPPA